VKLRIFVIDDEENIRETFKWHLESLGHEVVALPDPSYCAAYVGRPCEVEDACADILIIDYSMPYMDGLSFLELLERNNCLFAAQFIMILTGNANQIDKSVADRIGCEIRQKPMTVLELEEWVNSLAKHIPPDRKLADLAFLNLDNKKP